MSTTKELIEARLSSTTEWANALSKIGVPNQYLTGEKMKCPLCGDGADRFVFDNKHCRGDYFCRVCGAGDGFRLAQLCLNVPFPRVVNKLAASLGIKPGNGTHTKINNGVPFCSQDYLYGMLKQCVPADCPQLRTYLKSRGLERLPNDEIVFGESIQHSRTDSKPISFLLW